MLIFECLYNVKLTIVIFTMVTQSELGIRGQLKVKIKFSQI